MTLTVAFDAAGEAAGVGGEYSAGEFESDGEHDGRDDRGRADAVLRGERAGWERGGERVVVRDAGGDSFGDATRTR